MGTKRIQWFNRYYVIIVILCVALGLFIWILFRMSLSDLEEKNQDATIENLEKNNDK